MSCVIWQDLQITQNVADWIFGGPISKVQITGNVGLIAGLSSLDPQLSRASQSSRSQKFMAIIQ